MSAQGIGVAVGVLVGVGVCVGAGVDVSVGTGVEVSVGVANAVAVGVVSVGNIATDVAVGAGPHATDNKRIKHTATLLESKVFIFFRSQLAGHISADF